MKSFRMGVLGSFVGMAFVIGLGWMFLHQDIFEVERDGVPKFRVTATQGVTIGSTGSYENLVIETTGTNTVSITADAVTVEYVRLTGVNVTVNIGVLGAGGRDSALTEAANEWYYLFVITNNDGSSSNGLISESSTSPTLPSGYTKKRRVGAVRNDGSSNFLRFIQEGNKCMYADNQGILTFGQATTFTAVSAASFVPPTSRRAVMRCNAVVVHNAANVAFIGRLRETGGASAAGEIVVDETTQVANIVSAGNTAYGDCGVSSSGQVDYRIEAVPSGGGGVSAAVAGYYDRI